MYIEDIMKKFDIAISAILMVVAAAMFVAAGSLPEVDGAIGAGTWPRVLSVVLFLLAALLMLQGLADRSSAPAPFNIHSPGFRRVLIGVGIIAVFCILLKFLGFMLASVFLIPAVMRLMGEKRIPVLAGVTAGVLVFIYVVFSLILRLPLLQGSLF